jgi:hypothetical protein
MEEHQVTDQALKEAYKANSTSSSIKLIRLPPGQQWTGPAGKIVTCAFHCLACSKVLRTNGVGGRNWRQRQTPGAAAAANHAVTKKHIRMHAIYTKSKRRGLPLPHAKKKIACDEWTEGLTKIRAKMELRDAREFDTVSDNFYQPQDFPANKNVTPSETPPKQSSAVTVGCS